MRNEIIALFTNIDPDDEHQLNLAKVLIYLFKFTKEFTKKDLEDGGHESHLHALQWYCAYTNVEDEEDSIKDTASNYMEGIQPYKNLTLSECIEYLYIDEDPNDGWYQFFQDRMNKFFGLKIEVTNEDLNKNIIKLFKDD